MTVDERAMMVAWAAGFFDGEGSVTIRRNARTEQHWLYMQATQIRPEPLIRLRDLFGGTVHYKAPGERNWAPLYVWNCSCRKAAAALAEMAPYLTVKHAHADLAAEFVTHLARRGGQAGHEAPDRAGQSEARKRMAALNRRGSAREPSEEADVFRALGMDWIAPGERS